MPSLESANPADIDDRPKLFLDIDGVLNRCADSGFGLEEDKLELLAKIYFETRCRLVLSSTWRNYPDTKLPQLIQVLASRRMYLHGMTPDLTDLAAGSRIARAVPRWQEIQAWLNYNPETTRFVILDDEVDFGPLKEHHVQTWPNEGLTADVAEAVIHYLNA